MPAGSAASRSSPAAARCKPKATCRGASAPRFFGRNHNEDHELFAVSAGVCQHLAVIICTLARTSEPAVTGERSEKQPSSVVQSLMLIVRRYCSAERWAAIVGLTVVALFAWIYFYRCVYAYNERCFLTQGQTEGDPRLAGAFFFPLLIPIALATRTKFWLRVVCVFSILFAAIEFPAIVNPPDIATGCFGMGGDHDDQQSSRDGWALLTLLISAIAYGGITLGWLGIIFKTILSKLFPRVDWGGEEIVIVKGVA